MRNCGDLIGSILFALGGIGIVAESFRLKVGKLTEPQPGFFPFVSGVVLIVLSLVLLAYRWSTPGNDVRSPGNLRGPAILIAGMAVYVGVLDSAGYVLSTLFIGALILRVLGIRSWRVLCGASAVLSVGTYLLFARLLGIELPPGILAFLG
jgi:putative tricarboxylic transport membrane protein